MAEVTHDPATLARLDALAELLPVLAGALDVRDVFHHISRITREVLPHDALALAPRSSSCSPYSASQRRQREGEYMSSKYSYNVLDSHSCLTLHCS